MSDLIDRQQAIDELIKMLSYCFYADEEVIDAVVTTINELPPSQLSTNLAEVGTDCISRQAALDALYHVDEYNSRSVEAIRNLPSAEPQIIRCKDCKHWIPYDWMFSEMWQSKNIADYSEDEIGCALSDMAMKASDFCSRAETR